MRELPKPDEIAGDERATEMIRYWLAHDDYHISLTLGMWQDAGDSEVDELSAWGNVLGDIALHIANGMRESHGWDERETLNALVRHFASAIKERKNQISGGYKEDT
jgi:hypothetical protein